MTIALEYVFRFRRRHLIQSRLRERFEVESCHHTVYGWNVFTNEVQASVTGKFYYGH